MRRISICGFLVPAVFAGKVPAQTVTTRVDSARHEVVIDAGPFAIPAEDPEMLMEMKMGNMAMHHDEEVQVFRFDWPVDGLARGFRLELRDATGALLPAALLHHLLMPPPSGCSGQAGNRRRRRYRVLWRFLSTWDSDLASTWRGTMKPATMSRAQLSAS
jgi:hypothetical protein